MSLGSGFGQSAVAPVAVKEKSNPVMVAAVAVEVKNEQPKPRLNKSKPYSTVMGEHPYCMQNGKYYHLTTGEEIPHKPGPKPAT